LKKSILIYSLFLVVFITSCSNDRVSKPRPHSYPRIEFPERSYANFSESYCPLSFEYPSRSQINKKKFFFNDRPGHECWFNISLTDFDATLFFTYQEVESTESMESLVDDAFLLVSKHNDRANSREEGRISNSNGLDGVFFEIGGPVASPLQFYLTDNEKHFLRASLYYNNETANDSLQIVTDFIKQDLLHVISTTQFL